MDIEQMKMAIMEQEQTFRQQVHELHRAYHVQKQMMRGMETARMNQDHNESKPQLSLMGGEKDANGQRFHSFPNSSAAVSAEECDLELTLATGSSRSQKVEQVVKSSNSDSGTAVSSTSTDTELAQFKEFDVTAVRFQSERTRRADEMNQSPWLRYCVRHDDRVC